MSQDDYAPAIEAPEPTASPMIGDAPDLVSPNAGPRQFRAMSEGTRKLFQEIADKHKAAEGEQLEVDDLVPAVEHVVATPEAAKPVAATPTAAPAPTEDLAAKAIEHQRQVATDLREKGLADREAKLAAREKSLPDRMRFLSKPGETLRDMIKEWTGAESDGDLRDAITDAITELTTELGVPLDPSLKTAVETRKGLRSVKAHLADVNAREAKLVADRATADQAQREQHALGALAYVLRENATKYPFLTADDDPATGNMASHKIVWDVIKTKHEKEGVELRWEDAAALCETYLKEQEAARYKKRSHLLNPAAPQARPATTTTTQGVGPQNRQAPSVKTPAPTATVDSAADSQPQDEATRRRASIGKLMPRLKETSA